MQPLPEIIAVLLADAEITSAHMENNQATMLVRDAQGNVALQLISLHKALAHESSVQYFRRGKPIIDPVLRLVIGYEMENIATLPTPPHF